MSHEIKPQHLALADLADWCAHQTELYFQHQSYDPRYCFELFRRAIREQDQSAWELICLQYQALVAGWVRQHSRFESSGEDIQYFVNGAFGKIAVSLTPEKFGGFSEIGSLLRYLKLCVHSVIMDHIRLTEQEPFAPLEDASEEGAQEPTPEEQAMDRSEQQMLWDLINSRLQDEKERVAIYGSFVLALKPQELYELHRNLFSDVDEIYGVKQNMIARLRRDPEFRRLFG
jgi:DNA-directed RNA polymerase specialized sigma24 family protein